MRANKFIVLMASLLVLSGLVLAQSPQFPRTAIQFQNAGTNSYFGTGYFKLNFVSGCTSTYSAGVLGISCPGGGAFAYPVTVSGGVSGAVPCFTATTTESAGTLLTANALVVGGGAGVCPSTPSATSTLNASGNLSVPGFLKGGNTQLLTADATGITATTPGTIVFTWGALPVSSNYSFHCEILYSQTSAAVAGDGIAVQGATNAPTRLDAWAKIDSTDPASTNYTGSAGSALNITSTTATSVVTVTPGAAATVYQATVSGTIQVGASASTLNILMFTGNVSDSIVPKAGSFCTLMP